MEIHRKHAKLKRRDYGKFASNEVAILGGNCSFIRELVTAIASGLDSRYQLAYIDASHNDKLNPHRINSFTFHHAGELNLQGTYHQNPYLDKLLFTGYDLAFINGNHYRGFQQVLILDDEKEQSVQKRLDQLDRVRFIISKQERFRLFDSVAERHPYIKDLPVYLASDLSGIRAEFKKLITERVPPVKGLVLAGGKSLRMGTDKGLLDYFGKEHRVYAMELLEKFNLKTYFSVRKEQKLKASNRIEDVFLGLGPFGAICSAFQFDPNSAWLTLATDLPYVDEALVMRLLDHRDPSKLATAVKGKGKEFPEPLVTIWEPKAYPVLLQFLAQGISCPRKVLINANVATVETDDVFVFNVNTPDEFESVKKDLNC